MGNAIRNSESWGVRGGKAATYAMPRLDPRPVGAGKCHLPMEIAKLRFDFRPTPTSDTERFTRHWAPTTLRFASRDTPSDCEDPIVCIQGPVPPPLLRNTPLTSDYSITMSSASPLFFKQPLRYLKWASINKPAYFYSIIVGLTGPAMMFTVPPIRRWLGDEKRPQIPMTYPSTCFPNVASYDFLDSVRCFVRRLAEEMITNVAKRKEWV